MAATETAVLGGGCFWCLEAVYREIRGVSRVVSGYSGGAVDAPDYHAVCEGGTGHAEVVQIEFDPAVVSFRQLLEVFFVIHDPTTLNRQGNDVGTQYRSVIFAQSPAQRAEAEAVMDELRAAGAFADPIMTELVAAEHFWPAEDYHQDYLARNGHQPYCQAVVSPKLAKFRARFAALRSA
ncbi:peptide-methionine (S)-S-oxide reductase MsrA [Denitromonas ohlonensis]|jgi:peptide-methionine (S)-S-oxide reductase|uniref:Peptide methionine sulfoxide reductase MsrA n=2 Tax=Denitromonas TaxID=139331 RepID=A0A557RDM4_9RHOO|nr:peptide-methionine (S)-S-oxide reductase MsrA [Denitromonas ohlonensis]TVO63266.1 peptide-methionine (S)-S-oxide reductase MsrA [Denitromonas ohlonensis]TVO76187.1 peptide-methionine (S)-S-oxide reductase MsrA [Denitromonas ohlonensis]TVT47563.1 MAG: peptide-methionine (S)-S-oxide reductase MsrA [Denitromonas halophila]TVT69996.1 MAG: peptide-methionine (S)-S-oxide reductase MsrA [Denitromonas halophila]